MVVDRTHKFDKLHGIRLDAPISIADLFPAKVTKDFFVIIESCSRLYLCYFITYSCEITLGHLSRAKEALDFVPRLLISLARS